MINKKKINIIIYSELGKRNSGSGHFLRSLNLKKYLSNCSSKIVILFNKNINKKKFAKKNIFFLKKENHIIKFVKKDFKNLLIIDKYKINHNTLNNVKKYFNKIIIFNDLEFLKKVDKNIILINSQVTSKKKITKNKLIGSHYFPVNIELLNVRKKYKIKKNLKNIFVFFGGSIDTKKTRKIIIKLNSLINQKVNFFIYSNNNWKLKKLPKNIKFIKIKKNYYSDLLKYDAGIISSGFIKFDLLTIGMPVVYIPMYLHQIKLAKQYSNSNFGINLGYYKNINKNRKSLDLNISKNLLPYKKRYYMFNNYRSNFDGKGIIRIKKILLNL